MKQKYKLVGSAPTIHQISELITKWYHSNIDLIGQNDGSFKVKHCGGNFIDGVRVIYKSNRYRFEREIVL